MPVQLIALDWGTSSLRAYRLGPNGRVLEERSRALGIMQLPSAPRQIAGHHCQDGFELALDEACGDWLQAHPQVPLIACGMVGSAQGWREAAYCPTPARVADLGASLLPIDTLRGHRLYVVPGIIEAGDLPNVMRGEETQVLGLLQQRNAAGASGELLIGLPGSHSKWVRLVDGCIEHFDTFMTGEVYAALCSHTLLGRTQRPSAQFAQAAFERGVQVAASAQGDLGPLSNMFSARTLGLTGQLPGEQQADYLSGLLIGHELRALSQALGAAAPAEVALIGNDQLCQRYRLALAHFPFSAVTLVERATEQGLWSLAVAAGLVAPSSQEV